jgi:hypothetical protein
MALFKWSLSLGKKRRANRRELTGMPPAGGPLLGKHTGAETRVLAGRPPLVKYTWTNRRVLIGRPPRGWKIHKDKLQSAYLEASWRSPPLGKYTRTNRRVLTGRPPGGAPPAWKCVQGQTAGCLPGRLLEDPLAWKCVQGQTRGC